jgi:hypothetical protein
MLSGGHVPLGKTADASAVRPDPQILLPVDQQRRHLIAVQCLGISLIENGKVKAVKSGQSRLSSEPKVAIRRLRNRLNGGRDCGFSTPDLAYVLCDVLRRIETRATPQGREKTPYRYEYTRLLHR